jgi:hypothetical protein
MRGKIKRFLEICKDVRDKISAAYPVSKTLAGYCWFTSKSVQVVCEKEGLDVKVKLGYFVKNGWNDCDFGHAWLEYNHKYYDLTATQFGDYPEIMIESKKSPLFRESPVNWEWWITNSSEKAFETFLIDGKLKL